jgi:hypothetical protein
MRSTILKHSLAWAAVAATVGLAGRAELRAQAVVRVGATRTSIHASNVRVSRNINVYREDAHFDRWGRALPAAATVTASVTAIGTVVSTLPPQCSGLVVGAVTYQSCGGGYYQPVYQGSGVQYVVVNAPR